MKDEAAPCPAAVLLIDADPAFRAALRTAFAEAGYTVHCAVDDACGMVDFTTVRPGLVVTNITSSPGGIGNLLAMRRATPGVRIVAMAHGDASDAARCLAMASHLGADHMIVKPIDVACLIAWAGSPTRGAVDA